MTLAATPLQILSFSFSPSTISAGAQTNGLVTVSGGTPPYSLWFNNTPPGCMPPSQPVVSTSAAFSFNCNPSSAGSYSIHLDVLDSSTPVNRVSTTAGLTVNSNSGSGSGSGGKSNGSFSLPSGLTTLLTLFAFVFVGAVVALAAGVIATAVLLSRRMRQINESLAQLNRPPSPGKPPT